MTEILNKIERIALRGELGEPVITRNFVDKVWLAQLGACDRYEALVLMGADKDECECAWKEVEEATEFAQTVQSLFEDQYRRRQWLKNGRWNVEGV